MANTHYIDSRELTFDIKTLKLLRNQLNNFTLDVLRYILKENKKGIGLAKTKIDDYQIHRKKYDMSFFTLESQGFIEYQKDGLYLPYYLTIRGKQLIKLLHYEKKTILQENGQSLHNNIENRELIDYDSFKFSTETIYFFKSLLDTFTLEIFEKVIEENRNNKGLYKTQLPDYQNSRRKYDRALIMLTAQCLIEKRPEARATPYFVTIRGKQMWKLLKNL